MTLAGGLLSAAIAAALFACGPAAEPLEEPPRRPLPPSGPDLPAREARPRPRLAPLPVDPPPPEVASVDPPVDLPDVPSLGGPPQPGHPYSPRYLRAAGSSLRGRDLQVRGVVLWIYQCAPARGGGERCSKPHFRLGDRAGTPPERGLLVVDVPPQPQLKVGQVVVVTGTLALESPSGFRDRRGLLVFGSVTPAQ